jgi:hypothetical protein
MVIERPDFTESTEVVGKGVIQFENGLTVERDHGTNNVTAGETLVRVGISKRVELRFGGDGFLAQGNPGIPSVYGYSDVELAAKFTVFRQGSHTPAVSLIPMLSVPAGSKEFSSGSYDPTLKVAMARELRRGFSLSGNLNFSSLGSEDGRFLQTAISASLEHELGHGFGAYGEVFGLTALEKGGSAAWIANTGVCRLIGKDAQVDVRVGKRLTTAGPDLFWGVGIAIRQAPMWFPH